MYEVSPKISIWNLVLSLEHYEKIKLVCISIVYIEV